MELSHVNARGEAHMVDVSSKEPTIRNASAQAVVYCNSATVQKMVAGNMPKGDVFSCARIAGIMAAKRTAEFIPMCHPLPLSSVSIDIAAGVNAIRIVASVSCVYQTGVEMEALAAASIAALTIYDMCKAVDKSMVIGKLMLLQKTGGKSGTFIRPVIAAIQTKRIKGAPPVFVDTFEITRTHGDNQNSGKSTGNKTGGSDLSLLTGEARRSLETFDGICANRFWANIEASRLPDGAKEGSLLRLGGALCKINQIGRSCHQLCGPGKARDACPLVREAVFLQVVKEGILSVGDEIMFEAI